LRSPKVFSFKCGTVKIRKSDDQVEQEVKMIGSGQEERRRNA